jgi:hypothetical protein
MIMATVDELWLATLTKNEDDAGTDAGRLNVTIDVDGEDVPDMDFEFMEGSGFSSGLGPGSAWLGDGQAALTGRQLDTPLESALLTNSSIRLGIRTDDAWPKCAPCIPRPAGLRFRRVVRNPCKPVRSTPVTGARLPAIFSCL